MKARIVVAAIDMAVARRGDVAGCILHSDRGSQGGFNWWSQYLQTWRRAWDASRDGWWTVDGSSGDEVAGKAPIRRDVERQFWVKVVEGLSSEEAAIACAVCRDPSGLGGSAKRGGMLQDGWAVDFTS